MGSGAEVAHETVEYLAERGERVGLIKVRLFRPFSMQHFVQACGHNQDRRRAGPDQRIGQRR